MGDSGLYGHGSAPVDRHQRPTGGAPRLLRRVERHGPGPRAVRLHRRHGAAHRPQATAIAQIAANCR